MSDEIFAWLPKGQGPSSSARTLGHQLDRILTEHRKNPSEDTLFQGMWVLAQIIDLADPLVAHQRRLLAEKAIEGGADIDEWTGRDLEADPEMLRVARQVAAQMLYSLPGIMPPAADELLPSNLLTLNDGQARPFLTPMRRRKGGASRAELDRTSALRAMFWMRVGFDGIPKADMVRKFVELTGLSQRTIERIAGRASHESKLFKSIGESRKAGLPDPFRRPRPIPTDDYIRQLSAYFKD